MIEGKIANMHPCYGSMPNTITCAKCNTFFEAPIRIIISSKKEELFFCYHYLGTNRFIYEAKSGRAVTYCSKYCAQQHNHRFKKERSNVINIKQKYDKVTTQLVSYEATIGYLKDAFYNIIGTEDSVEMRQIAMETLKELKK